MTKLHELEPGARFFVNGLEDDGELELVRLEERGYPLRAGVEKE